MLFKKNVCVLVLLCCKVVLSIKKTAVSLDEAKTSNKKCLKTDGAKLKSKSGTNGTYGTKVDGTTEKLFC
jgi:hypothetical protein